VPNECVLTTQEIMQRRYNGETLQTIATDAGVSRQRIEQIISAEGGISLAEVQHRRRKNAEKAKQALTERIREEVAQGAYSSTDVAERLGLSKVEVSKAWPEDLSKSRLTPQNSPLKYTDEDLFKYLREVPPHHPDGLCTVSKYKALREAGTITGPTPPTFYKRFGTWNAACEAAGVPHGEGRAFYAQNFSDEQIIDVMVEYLNDHPHPSVENYSAWARDKAHAPSLALFRIRFGFWNEAKRRAIEKMNADA
jgi:AraC-like DNA-binding protein